MSSTHAAATAQWHALRESFAHHASGDMQAFLPDARALFPAGKALTAAYNRHTHAHLLAAVDRGRALLHGYSTARRHLRLAIAIVESEENGESSAGKTASRKTADRAALYTGLRDAYAQCADDIMAPATTIALALGRPRAVAGLKRAWRPELAPRREIRTYESLRANILETESALLATTGAFAAAALALARTHMAYGAALHANGATDPHAPERYRAAYDYFDGAGKYLRSAQMRKQMMTTLFAS